jgi:predicted PurR-regulated permease PerM
MLVLGIFSATGAFLASFALIPIYIFFLSYYQDKFKEFIRLITKDDKHDQALLVAKKVTLVSQKYLIGIFLDVLILSVLNSTGFLILGLPHAILFGVFASILNIIPYIGVLIGSTLPILMAFLTKDEMSYPLAVAGICFFVQFLDNNFITPYVVGSSVSINPLTAIFVLIASALIWGIPGMVLCIPLTGMAKVVCDNVESMKPYGFLLGEEVNFRTQEHIQDKLVNRLLKRNKKGAN